MNQSIHDNNAILTGYGLSGSFLMIHIAMFFLFRRYGVTPMMYFNIFSIVFYIGAAWMLKADLLYLFTVSVYLEVSLHMTLAVIFVGTDSGFQVTLIGTSALIFYAEYLGDHMKRRHVSGTVLSVIGALMYLGAIIYNAKHPAAYALPQEVKFWLQIAWGIITFSTSIFFLKVLVFLTVRSERMLADMAQHDYLTGLYNRSGYEEKLRLIDVRSTALLLIDVDNFKDVNDTYGHEMGDLVLKKVADEIKQHFRAEDHVCRLGGDEFVVLMCSQGELSEAPITEKVDEINAALAHAAGLPLVSVSVGAAFGGESAEQLFDHADKALYQRKQLGRGGGCCFFQNA